MTGLILQDPADLTKQLDFDLSAITTGTKRTITVPNASGTLSLAPSGGAVGGANSLTTPGALPIVASAGVLTQDATNLFWDDTNNRLGVGTNAPTQKLELAAPGATNLRIRDTDGSGGWNIGVHNFVWSAVNNTTLGISYNADLAIATQPAWSENWEPRFVDGAPPLGLLEKNWAYQNIDRSVNYRPFGFSVDLNTSIASTQWLIGNYRVIGPSQTVGTQESLKIYTPNRAVSMSGRLTIGGLTDSPPYPLTLVGSTQGTTMLAITPTTVASGDSMILLSPSAVTGNVNWVSAASQVSGIGYAIWRNTGTGDVQNLLWAGSGGDASIRYLANEDWASGVDRSDSGKFKISNSGTLGTNDRFVLTAAGDATLSSGVVVLNDTAIRRTSAGLLAIDNGTAGQHRDLQLRNLIQALTTPASASATGVAGTITADADYVYVCTATDTWKRVAISTWP